jgi:hypothetical protein
MSTPDLSNIRELEAIRERASEIEFSSDLDEYEIGDVYKAAKEAITDRRFLLELVGRLQEAVTYLSTATLLLQEKPR